MRGKAEIYCDGASEGNPGDSGIGVVMICHKGKGVEVYKISEYIGVATNNIAEYSALIRGLEEAELLGFRKIKVFLDSELLVKQIEGIYRVKSHHLKRLWIQAQNILRRFQGYTITHVQRDLNKEADSLAREAIRNHKKSP